MTNGRRKPARLGIQPTSRLGRSPLNLGASKLFGFEQMRTNQSTSNDFGLGEQKKQRKKKTGGFSPNQGVQVINTPNEQIIIVKKQKPKQAKKKKQRTQDFLSPGRF